MSSSKMPIRMKLTTTAMLVCCQLMILITLLVGTNLGQILSQWGQDNQLTVYVKPEIEITQIEALSTRLKNESSIASVRHITAAEAADEFSRDTETFGKAIAHDIPLKEILTDSLEVSLKKELSISDQVMALGELAKKYQSADGVEALSYGQEWVEKFAGFVSTAKAVGGFGVLTIFVLCGFLLSTSMKSLVLQKQKEIEILEMVGASKAFIRKPFLKSAFSLAVLSSAIAVGILFLAFLAIRDGFSAQIAAYGLTPVISFLSFSDVLGFVAVTTAFCFLAVYLALTKLNRGGHLNA